MQKKKAFDSRCEYCGYHFVSKRVKVFPSNIHPNPKKPRYYYPYRPTLCPQCKYPWIKTHPLTNRDFELEKAFRAEGLYFSKYSCPQCGYHKRSSLLDNIQVNKDTDPEKAKQMREKAEKRLRNIKDKGDPPDETVMAGYRAIDEIKRMKREWECKAL